MLTTAAQLCVRNLKENSHFIYFYAMFDPLISVAEKEEQWDSSQLPLCNPFIFTSAPHEGRQVRNRKNQLNLLSFMYVFHHERSGHHIAFLNQGLWKVYLYFYITFIIIHFSTVFCPLAQHQKLWKRGKRNKTIWCNFTISFFLESQLQCVWKFLFNCRRYTLLTDYLEVNVKGDRLIIL